MLKELTFSEKTWCCSVPERRLRDASPLCLEPVGWLLMWCRITWVFFWYCLDQLYTLSGLTNAHAQPWLAELLLHQCLKRPAPQCRFPVQLPRFSDIDPRHPAESLFVCQLGPNSGAPLNHYLILHTFRSFHHRRNVYQMACHVMWWKICAHLTELRTVFVSMRQWQRPKEVSTILN